MLRTSTHLSRPATTAILTAQPTKNPARLGGLSTHHKNSTPREMFSTDAFMADHATAVAAISSQVNSFHARKAPFRIYHGSTNSTRASSRNTSNTVDCSTLNHVLRVDRAAKTAWVEPNIAMDQLVEATLKEGLLPKVVMEFPGITVGGGWNGTSGESSSFRQGFFDGTVAKVEIVLPSGEVVVATNENEYADLYRGSSSAVGTLGVTTLLEVRLVEARRYVELTYHPIKSMDEGVHRIKETIEDKSVEYCDGILFSKDEGVICTGKLVDEASTPGTPVQRFSRAHDQWFYIQAQKNVTSHPDPAMPKVELVPVVDYFFRYNRGGFWVGTLAFRWFKLPFNRWNRWLLNHFMLTRNMYHALHASGHDRFYIIQDVGVPLSASSRFVDEYIEPSFKQYPIWLCPLLQAPISSPFSPRIMAPPAAEADVDHHGGDPSKMMLSFGVWGAGPLLQGGSHEDFVAANRLLEEKVHALGGKKWLYAHTYYTEEEFWNVYDKPAYDALREKYDAKHLLDVYQKVRVKEMWRDMQKREKEEWGAWLRGRFWAVWPISGVYGALSLVFGRRDYLRRGAAKVKAVAEGKKEV